MCCINHDISYLHSASVVLYINLHSVCVAMKNNERTNEPCSCFYFPSRLLLGNEWMLYNFCTEWPSKNHAVVNLAELTQWALNNWLKQNSDKTGTLSESSVLDFAWIGLQQKIFCKLHLATVFNKYVKKLSILVSWVSWTFCQKLFHWYLVWLRFLLGHRVDQLNVYCVQTVWRAVSHKTLW